MLAIIKLNTQAMKATILGLSGTKAASYCQVPGFIMGVTDIDCPSCYMVDSSIVDARDCIPFSSDQFGQSGTVSIHSAF